jgi:branched-chain amino acid transport system permease protein
MVAVRDNEVAAEVNGVDVARVKVITFGLASGFAGVGGALFALKEGQVFPQTFIITASFYFLVAVVVGGSASVAGPALGALVFGIIFDVVRPELPERLAGATPLILAVFLIGFMYFAPGGLVGLIRQGGARLRVGGRRSSSATVAEGTIDSDDAQELASGEASPGNNAGEPSDD